MIKVNINLLQILKMNSQVAKEQGESSNQSTFHLSADVYLWTTLKSDISEVYKAQVNYLKYSEPYSYDKNDMKEKVNDLVR